MTDLRRLLCAVLLCAMTAQPCGAEAARLVIRNARIVDVRGGALTEPMDVELVDGRIAAIRAAGASMKDDVPQLDASGGYVLPGFWDMHAHINSPEDAETWLLPAMLAAGVTGVRDMAGDCWQPGCRDSIRFVRGLQERIEKGELRGPRILAISSAPIHGPRQAGDRVPRWATPATSEQAKELVRELQRRGVDFIKPYDTLSREAYFAMLSEAHGVGLSVSGHVPLAVTTLEAVRGGQRTIEHAKHPLLDCSGYSATFHQVFAAWASGESQSIYESWARRTPNARSLGSLYQPVLVAYDERRCDEVIAELADSHVYYVPTLVTRRFEARADEGAFLADPRLADVPVHIQVIWRQDSNNYKARFTRPAEKQAYVRFYELAMQTVVKAYRAGVPILIGTDAPDSYCFPGSSFHDELQELHAAGVPNAVILRAATLGAAEFLGRTAQFGTVEPGKIADLLVLDANPLENIAGTRRIRAVILGGRLIEQRSHPTAR